MKYEELNKAIDTLDAEGRQLYFQYPGRFQMSEGECMQLIQRIARGEIKESAGPVAGIEITEGVMESLYKTLQGKLEKMSESQHTLFMKQARGRSVESKIAIADAVLANKPIKVKEGFSGKRNNGSGWGPANPDAGKMQEADRKLFESLGMTSEQIERELSDGLPKAIRESNDARVIADYKFLRAINIPESAAIKGALNNTLRK